jgi:hypothetical protein
VRKAYDLAIPVRPYEPALFQEVEAIVLYAVLPEIVEHLRHPDPFLHLPVEPRIITGTAVWVALLISDLIGAIIPKALPFSNLVNTATIRIRHFDTVKLMAHVDHCLTVVEVA